jgi:hypothetical protein
MNLHFQLVKMYLNKENQILTNDLRTCERYLIQIYKCIVI